MCSTHMIYLGPFFLAIPFVQSQSQGNNFIAHSNHSFAAISTHGHGYWIWGYVTQPMLSGLNPSIIPAKCFVGLC